MNIEMKRRYYFKTVITNFFNEHFGEVIDEKMAALLRSKIEVRPSAGSEFEVKLIRGNIVVYHLGEKLCSSEEVTK